MDKNLVDDHLILDAGDHFVFASALWADRHVDVEYRRISRELSPNVKNYAALLHFFSDFFFSGFSRTSLT